jgi:hypothetical protein
MQGKGGERERDLWNAICAVDGEISGGTTPLSATSASSVVGCREAAAEGGCAGRERRSLGLCGARAGAERVKNGNRRLVRPMVEGIVGCQRRMPGAGR